MKIIKLVLMVSSICCLLARIASAEQEGNSTFWASAIKDLMSAHQQVVRQQARNQIVNRIKDRPDFLKLVRLELRLNENVWVRRVAAASLVQALGPQAHDDCLFMLSDTDAVVRGYGQGAIDRYSFEDLIESLPSQLLSKVPEEREAALAIIRRHLKNNGLPYYSHFIADPDPSSLLK